MHQTFSYNPLFYQKEKPIDRWAHSIPIIQALAPCCIAGC